MIASQWIFAHFFEIVGIFAHFFEIVGYTLAIILHVSCLNVIIPEPLLPGCSPSP